MVKVKYRGEGSASGKKTDTKGKTAIKAFFLLFFILFPKHSLAVWPFAPVRETPYVAMVGDTAITTEEFVEEVNRLHKSGRVGEALSKEKVFLVQDYRKFLYELIENKLMAGEAERLSFDKKADFLMSMDNFKMNLFLENLRSDEISGKATVTDTEIEEYYNEEQKKKEAAEKAKKEEAKKAEEAEKPPEKAMEAKKMTPAEKENIRRSLLAGKALERESEYFSFIRASARIKIKEDVLKEISLSTKKPEETIVATANGEPIYALDVLRSLTKGEKDDSEARMAIVERLVLRKLLDAEAVKRGAEYEKLPEIAKKIQRYREERLIDAFRRKVVLPLIKVDENEILEYYNANTGKFMDPGMFKLRMILVKDEKEAKELVSELKRGADFGFLAKKRSIDPSKEKGGEAGWVPEKGFSKEILEGLRPAKPGDILGPFAVKYGYSVLELQDIKKGGRMPLERARKEIDAIVGRENFKKTLERYLARLKETVPVRINEEELKRMAGG